MIPRPHEGFGLTRPEWHGFVDEPEKKSDEQIAAERREWWRWTIAKDLAAGILANHDEMSGPESVVLGAVYIAGMLIAELEKTGERK